MRRSASIFLVLFTFLTVAVPLAAQTTPPSSFVNLSIGHSGAVADITSHPSQALAFTVGDDGRLGVWDLSTKNLYRRFQISPHPITRITHHPSRNEIAMFIRERVGSGVILAFNWETGEEIFRHQVDAIPTYLNYSPTGSYVVYATPSYQSLSFLASDTGDRRPYFENGFGVVGFVQMAQSERNVMTYLPTRGEFVYWQVTTGDELQRVGTRARLQHLRVVDPETRRLLAASDGSNLLIVDNLTGDVKATYPLAPIIGIQYDPESRLILV
ncbi:MAG: hypothetical protein E4H09_00310, partial [Spirochaetales bacterium]